MYSFVVSFLLPETLIMVLLQKVNPDSIENLWFYAETFVIVLLQKVNADSIEIKLIMVYCFLFFRWKELIEIKLLGLFSFFQVIEGKWGRQFGY